MKKKKKNPTKEVKLLDLLAPNTVNPRLADTAIMDTSIIRTASKFSAKINYRRSTKINSSHYGLSNSPSPRASAIKGVYCTLFIKCKNERFSENIRLKSTYCNATCHTHNYFLEFLDVPPPEKVTMDYIPLKTRVVALGNSKPTTISWSGLCHSSIL